MSLPQSRLQLSDRLYRKFLVAYSSEYWEKFGDEMAQVFRDLCLEVYRERGAAGLVRLWGSTMFDLLKTAVEDRLRSKPIPAARILEPIVGWAALAGGFLTLVFAFTHASSNYIEWVFQLRWL
jgi:hypothetical protein